MSHYLNFPDNLINYFVTVPPSIQILPPNGQVVTRKGGPVSFECKANGNPSPTVQWSKKVNSIVGRLLCSFIYFH